MSTRRRVIGLAVTAVSVYMLIPSLTTTFGSWPDLQRLRPGSMAIMTILMLLSLVCLWVVLELCLRSRAWRLIAVSQLASSAISRVLPGGAATATAAQYRILHQGGISRSRAAMGLTMAAVVNYAVLFALPVVWLPAIVFGPPLDTTLVTGTVVGAVSLVGAAVIGFVLLRFDGPLRLLGSTVDRIVARIKPGPPDRAPRSQTYLSARDTFRENFADVWYWVVLASTGKWVLDYLTLAVAVYGTGHEGGFAAMLLAFVTASLLGRIPLTPGGLGFVEAGLAGMLVLTGVSAGDAATATLAYRLVSFWLPIPLGAIAYGLYRARRHREGVELAPMKQLGSDDETAPGEPSTGELSTEAGSDEPGSGGKR